VVGVLGPGFRFPYEADAWVPEVLSPGTEVSVAAIGRLTSGVSPEQAQQELDAIAVATEDAHPDTNRGLRYTMQPLREQLIGNQARVTWSLFATAAVLLLLSCANVTNLLLARGTHRVREIAVQSAMGASRPQQARRLIVEVLLYCGAGTVAGVLIAVMAGDIVMTLVPLPLRTQLGLGDVAFDWRVVAFAALATSLTAVIAALAPMRRVMSTNPADALRNNSRGVAGSPRMMNALVVGEIALAAVLLMASALMADNLSRLQQADLGIRPDHLSTIEITLPDVRYDTANRRIAAVRSLVDAAAHLPGVTAAGATTVNPLDRGSVGAAIESEDRPLAPREAGLIVNNRLVSPGWFEAAGVRLVRGRFFSSIDSEHSARVVIVSQRLSDRLWPGAQPLGKRIRLARPNSPWLTVIGVAGDVRDFGEWRETWYLPYEQHASAFGAGTIHLMLRSALPPDVLGSGMRQRAQSIDAHLPIPVPTPMTSLWDAGLEQQRLARSASALFGASGLLLAVIGTYGVLAYAVSTRRREIGIRLALGAARQTVLTGVLRGGALLTCAGLLIGVGAGTAASKALAGAAAAPGIPITTTVVLLAVLAASAVAASLVPALRATRIDPAAAMRTE
jgi:putative ABC transport system permease protein